MRGPAALILSTTFIAALATPGCGESTRAARGATPATAADRPDATAPAERVRFTFALTRRPAAGLVATFSAPGGGAPAPAQTLDADGALRLPAGDSGLRLVDPVSGLVLLAAASRAELAELRAATREGALELPLPVRLVGRVSMGAGAGGFSGPADQLELHVGVGPRISVADYASRVHAVLAQPLPGLPLDEDRAWGLRLPPISTSWKVLRPRLDGSFDAGWLPLVAAPQLIAADRAGTLATLEVALPVGLAPRALLDAGVIAPQPSAALELDGGALPATDLPLLLQASLDEAEVAAADASAAALRLTLLHRLDFRAASFAVKRRPVELAASRPTRVAGLPRFARLQLRVFGPRPGILLRRTLTPAAASAAPSAAPSAATSGASTVAVTRVPLSAAELLGAPRRIPLTGKVRFSDGSPAAGATVVYGSYPDRREVRTDRNGGFAIPAIAAGREAVLFVDAPSAGRPPFDRAHASERLEIPADRQRVEVELTVPRPSAPFTSSASIVSCPGGQPTNVTDPISYNLPACAAITQSEQLAFCPLLGAYLGQEPVAVDVAELQVNPDGGETWARLRLAAPGTYNFLLSYSPFVYAITAMEIPTTDFVNVRFAPPAPWPTAVLVATDPLGRPAANLNIAFPNWVYDADAYDGLTDQNGAMQVDCFNLNPVDSFVDSDQGCYQGPVDLRARGANLTLGSCEGF